MTFSRFSAHSLPSFSRRAITLAVSATLLVAPPTVIAQGAAAPVPLATGNAPAPAPAPGADKPGAPTSQVPATDSNTLAQVGDLSSIPAPTIAARAWISIDVNSGQVLASSAPDTKVEPASLSKIITAYVVFNALDEKRLTLEQQVPVSETAWRTGGSRMFIEPRKPVTVNELNQGMIVQSGNDASVALAEAVGGS